MTDPGWLSVVPPIVAIGLAIGTKQVYLSLGLYVWLSWTILHAWNPLTGLIHSVDVIVAVFENGDNTRVLVFSMLIGAMITLTQASGGMEGFIKLVERMGLAASRRSVGLIAFVVSMLLFLETNFGLLVTGSVARPLFDRHRISREKLSYIIDATCSPKTVSIPLNAWGAYIVTLLTAQAVSDPVRVLVSALPLNFYAITAITVALVVVMIGWDLGPMRTAERRVREEGKVLRDGAQPLVSDEVVTTKAREGVPHRAVNMIAPIATMVLTVPFVLWLTGDGDFMQGSGSRAVLWGVIAGIGTALVLYKAQGIMTVKEVTDHALRGMQGLMPLVLLLVLAFAIGNTTVDLGTGAFVAQATQAAVPSAVVPAIIFLLACFIAFSTGTSWGTFAIMIPIVMPMVSLLGLHPGLALAAALGGGIFGDHCSPISDSTVVASMAAATDHIDHVRTQLPYALFCAGVSVILFLIFGTIL